MTKRNDGHNLGCGAMIAIELGFILLAIILASDADASGSEYFVAILIGAFVGYIVASYLNSKG